jgi:hypothetical protein
MNDPEEKIVCAVCGDDRDVVFDDDGTPICCDCLFENETYDINQP